MNMDTIFVHNDKFEVNTINNQMVIFDEYFKKVYVLRDLEKSIWDLFDGKKLISDIIEKIVDIYNVEDIQEDLLAFISHLIAENILVEV